MKKTTTFIDPVTCETIKAYTEDSVTGRNIISRYFDLRRYGKTDIYRIYDKPSVYKVRSFNRLAKLAAKYANYFGTLLFVGNANTYGYTATFAFNALTESGERVHVYRVDTKDSVKFAVSTC